MVAEIWTIRGVAEDVRKLASERAKAQRMTLGEWVAEAVRAHEAVVKAEWREPAQLDQLDLIERLKRLEGRVDELLAQASQAAQEARQMAASASKGAKGTERQEAPETARTRKKRAILSEEDVAEIDRLLSEGELNNTEIGERLSVTPECVRKRRIALDLPKVTRRRKPKRPTQA